MESATVTLIVQPTAPAPSITHVSLHNRRIRSSHRSYYRTGNLRFRLQSRWSVIFAAKGQLPELESDDRDKEKESSLAVVGRGEGSEFGWIPAFPHVLTASMANFLFGYHIGVMNGPIVSIARELGFEGNSILEGLVVSIFIVGALLGSLSCGSLVDRLGCRLTFQIDSIPLILGALLSAQAKSIDEILLGRFLVGLGIGVNTVLVPIYISEVAPTKYRGSLGTLCQIGTCLGIIASLFLGIPSEDDPHWWRTILYLASVPGFVLTLGMQFAAESPRWLCKVGRLDDAKQVIRSLWGASEVDRAVEEFQSVMKNDGTDIDSKWSELLEQPHLRGDMKTIFLAYPCLCLPIKRSLSHAWSSMTTGISVFQREFVVTFFLLILRLLSMSRCRNPSISAAVASVGGALFVLQQFAGINGILYFSSLTFKDVGITNGALASLLIGITNFAGAMGALFLMDREGRKKLLIGSYLGMAASMFIIVYAITSQQDEDLSHALSVLGSIMYIFTFAIGAGPVTGIIIPELSSNKMRGKIMGFSFSVHWVCNFLVGLFFLELIEKYGVGSVYAVFGSVSLLSALFAYYFTVETKGRSLEEIEMSLNTSISSGGDS